MPASRKHGPNRLSNYVETHQTVMQQFVSRGFVLADGVDLSPFGNARFLVSGTIQCVGEIVVTVHKVLDVVDGEGPSVRVKTVEYSYNATLQGVGNILRYDSPHPGGHRAFHHVHRYDTLAGDTEGSIEEVDDDQWPTLGDLLGELEGWYYTNFDRLSSHH